MGRDTKIEWCDTTWNPISGCTKVSEGCRNCYAEGIAERFAGTKAYPNGFAVTLHPEKLEAALRWRKPRRVFVCSMGDLFHEAVPETFIGSVFRIMEASHAHTFLVLTKRPERMRAFLAHRYEILPGFCRLRTRRVPLPRHVWLGVSVEDQATADERIPELLQTPAAMRFVSYEPALGPVDLRRIAVNDDYHTDALDTPDPSCRLHWVIAGGESGRRARPAHPDWFRAVRDQCQEAGVPFFFKQWGAWVPDESDFVPRGGRHAWVAPDGTERNIASTPGMGLSHQDVVSMGCARMGRWGKKLAGRELDVRTHDEAPGGGAA